MPADFTHLHLHTLYSLLDGAIRLPDLMESCARTGMKSVAVTDHGNMFGVVNFYQEAKKAGVKPIIGFEAYVAGEKGMANKEQRIGNHLVLLAMNDAGYRNLRYLSTKAFQEGFYYDPRVDKPLLRAHNEGIIALTACMAGAVPKAIRRGDMDEARREARELKEIFGDRLYLEVQSNALKEQLPVNHGLCELSKDLQIPLVATADSHYVKREDAKAHEVLMAIASGRTFDDPRRLRHETEELYIKAPEEMASSAEATTGVGGERRCTTRRSSPSAATSSWTWSASTFPSSRCPKGRPSTRTSSGGRARGSTSDSRRSPGRAGRSTPTSTASGSSASCPSSSRCITPATSSSFTTSSTGRSSTVSPWVRAAAPEPGRWSRTRCASPTSIRSRTIYCSSGS